MSVSKFGISSEGGRADLKPTQILSALFARLRVYIRDVTMMLEGNSFNANGAKISHVAEPAEGGDAANKSFVQNALLEYDARASKRSEIYVKYIRNKCLVYNHKDEYDAKGRTLINVGWPKDEKDAVTKAYINAILAATVTELRKDFEVRDAALFEKAASYTNDKMNTSKLVKLQDETRRIDEKVSEISDNIDRLQASVSSHFQNLDASILERMSDLENKIKRDTSIEIAKRLDAIKKIIKEECDEVRKECTSKLDILNNKLQHQIYVLKESLVND